MDKYTFSVVTFEHDVWNNTTNTREKSREIFLINKKYKQVKLEPFFGKNINEDNTFNITRCIDKYPI